MESDIYSFKQYYQQQRLNIPNSNRGNEVVLHQAVPSWHISSHQSQPEESEEKDGKKEEIEEELTEDQLPVIQAEVDQLQAQFDAAVDEKHSLEMELVSMKERLKAATDMVERWAVLSCKKYCFIYNFSC